MNIQEMLAWNKEAGKILCNLGNYPIVFPDYSNGTARVSEQESKIILCALLWQENIPFSVETPTMEKYKFTGEGYTSARSDLTVYAENKKDRLWNIELKAHNAQQKNIDKDFEKLAREQIPGNWFHTLGNADSGTIKALIEKFNKALENAGGIKKDLIISMVVIDKKTMFTYVLHKDDPKIPNIDYSVSGGEITVSNLNGWEQHSCS